MASQKWKYDAFLSFRGEDTRNNFVAHLHKRMEDAGIHAFKDDAKLDKGKFITPELLKAIEESRFLIIVFSEKYASSTWCLEELTKIMDCVEKKGLQEAIPIFYNVDPSDVRMRSSRSSFAKAMAKHKANLKGTDDLMKAERWKDALGKAASIAGWDVRKTANGDEAKCIELVVNKIYHSVEGTISSFTKHLVGIESRVKEAKSLLNVELGGVYFLGIWGMGGVGKTTVARAIFDEISYQFQGKCFLANVSEVSKKHGPEGPEHLQKKLLSQILKQHSLNIASAHEGVKMISRMLQFKKVLIVLDDVDDDGQLDYLVGNRDWFGDGSRIIITTRNNNLLRKHDELYHVPQLAIHEALELFSWHAFQQGAPHKEFEKLSISVVNYANGLPLALMVLGSFLYKRGMNEWRSSLDRLKDIGDGKIIKQLSLSLDGLSHEEQDIFLDIACFFRGKKKDDVITILNSFGFESEIGIHILTERALLYILEGMVEMHDLIEQMGQQVARDTDRDQPWKHSRLLHDKDVETVFSANLWTEKIKGIMVPIGSDRHICKWSKAFRNMPCLRLLIVKGDEVRRYDPVSDPVEDLPSSLNWLDWSYCSFESLPENFQPRSLVGLQMTYSSLVEICKEPKTFDKLAVLNLSFSENLLQTPDFSETPHLQRIILKGCVSMIAVHPSIGYLKKLIFLNMENCKNLKCLPNSIQMESLESFNLSGCEKLHNFPEILGKMEFLSELILARTAIQELPSSIGRFTGINLLDLSSCGNLVTLPASINEMKKLIILNVKGCSKLAVFPENLCYLEQLEEINAGNTAIWELPTSFGNLSNLRILSLKRGWKVRHHQSAGSLILPKSFGSLKELKILDLSGCNLSGKEMNDICCLTSLLELNLSRNENLSLPDSISQLSQLQYLNLTYCMALTKLPELPPSIKELYAEDFLAPQAILALPECPGLHLVSFTKYSFDQQPYTENSNDDSFWDMVLSLFLSDMMNNVVHPSFNSSHKATDSIVFPGREIPSWFNYKSSEEKISFKLPEFWCSLEFEGFAICCVSCMGAGVHGPGSQLSGKYDYTFIKAKLSCNNYQEELKVLEIECKVGTASRKNSSFICFAYIPLYSLLVGSGTEGRDFNQYGVFEATIERGVTRQWGVHLMYKTGRDFFGTRLHYWQRREALRQEMLSQYQLSFNRALELNWQRRDALIHKTGREFLLYTSKNYSSSNVGFSATSSSAGLTSFSASASEDDACLGEILPTVNLKEYSLSDLKAATRNFKFDRILGEGSFGTVFKAWVDEKMLVPTKAGNGMAVAIKKWNSEMSSQGFEEWQAEVNFLGRLSHPNLVKLLGFCWENKEMLLVYEFMPKGSFENHLFRRSTAIEPPSWNLRLKIAIGAARALAFLHSLEKQIIYRDFKSSNILLDGNYHAKLTDFGLAKLGPSAGVSHVTTRVMGTYGYAAPEYVATGHLYVKSDVYGFGVVLLEILTGLRTIDTKRPSEQHSLVHWVKPMLSRKRKLRSIMDRRMEGQYSTKAAALIAQLTLKCLEPEPKERPSMNEVVEVLKQAESI